MKSQLAELIAAVTKSAQTYGLDVLSNGETAAAPLIEWLSYIQSSLLTGTADCLVEGVASAIREALACDALGLVRPAVGSLRLEVDLCLAWLYFKDHPVEWTRVQQTGEGFKLKSELLKYLAETCKGFPQRMAILTSCKTRQVDDPYRLLSGHIHGQTEAALPNVVRARDIVASDKLQADLIEMQRECSEYVSDVLWSTFVRRWAAIPKSLRGVIMSRFKSAKDQAAFFLE
jgi:hypothetical protein